MSEFKNTQQWRDYGEIRVYIKISHSMFRFFLYLRPSRSMALVVTLQIAKCHIYLTENGARNRNL